MSAFYVGHETVQDVCMLVESLTGTPRDKNTLTRLGQALLSMNRHALMQRYPDAAFSDFAGDEYPEDFTYRPGGKTSYAQQAKSARCLRYQCAEGNVPDLPLYKRLDALCEAVGEPDGYDAAQWGR